jgi:hypothetical protein
LFIYICKVTFVGLVLNRDEVSLSEETVDLVSDWIEERPLREVLLRAFIDLVREKILVHLVFNFSILNQFLARKVIMQLFRLLEEVHEDIIVSVKATAS